MNNIDWPKWVRSWPCIDSNCDNEGTVCVGGYDHGNGDIELDLHQCQFCDERERLAVYIDTLAGIEGKQGASIEELERQNAILMADRQGPWAAREERKATGPQYDCGDCGKPIIQTGMPIPGTDVLGYQRFCDECIDADLRRDEISDADIALDERLERQQTAADVREAMIESPAESIAEDRKWRSGR